jgi:ATP-dependent DNA ligase
MTAFVPSPAAGRTSNCACAPGRSLATAFPEVLDALARLPDDLVLDAELVVPDAAGRSDFAELRVARCSNVRG